MAKVQCRNCDEFGHESRGCPKPRDSKSDIIWTKLTADVTQWHVSSAPIAVRWDTSNPDAPILPSTLMKPLVAILEITSETSEATLVAMASEATLVAMASEAILVTMASEATLVATTSALEAGKLSVAKLFPGLDHAG